MRKLSPAYIVASVALALASTTAAAQLRIATSQGTTSAGTTSSTSSGSTATIGGARTATGGCVGTGGSTCSATTSSPGPSGTGSGSGGFVSNRVAPSETNPNENVRGPVSDGSGTTVGDVQMAGVQPVANTGVPPDLPFRTTPNTPDATPTGAALGRSLGQTSSGTLAGNSGLGLTGDSLGLGPTDNIAGGLVGNVIVPGATTTGFTGGADTGGGLNANGERVGNGGADFRIAANQVTPTPIFNAAAARGLAREQARRARGDEPRIIGLAPRTERDLTHQMPDDPIIRY